MISGNNCSPVNNLIFRRQTVVAEPERNGVAKYVFWQMCVSCGHEAISHQGIDWDLVKVGAKKAT
jgi:hypothetical protein